MDQKPTDTAKIIDTIIALDTIMPALLDIIARQGPVQREELEAVLTYAIYRYTSQDLETSMKGVADILRAWKAHIAARPKILDA
jgi:hypothetical protein